MKRLDTPSLFLALSAVASAQVEVAPSLRDDAQVPPRGAAFAQAEDATPAGVDDFAPAAMPALSIDRSQLHYARSGDDVWARGATYKARAAPTGFTYFPFLGSDAPRSFPVEFELRAARRGGRLLPLAERATVALDGDRVVLDRGPVDVVYDLEIDRVEQRFVVESAAEDSGDLTVTLDVTTDLTGSLEGRAIRFGGAHGGMIYGEAFLVDGAGRREAIPTRFDGHSIELEVSAELLASSHGPVVIDPIFVTYDVDGATGFQRDVDVAFDRDSNDFLFVYEDQFSGTDVDLYATWIDSDSGFVEGGAYVELGAEDWQNPSVANLNRADRSLVVADRVEDGTGIGQVVGRMFDHTTLHFGPTLVIGEGGPFYSDTRPDVGGNFTSTSGGLFCVTWVRRFSADGDVRFRTVAADGTLGIVSVLETLASVDAREVSISESTGSPSDVNVWHIAWIEEELPTGVVNLDVVEIDAAGAVAAGPSPLRSFSPGWVVTQLDVSDAILIDDLPRPTYAMVYDVSDSSDHDTVVSFCRGTDHVAWHDLHRSEHANVLLNQSEPRIAATFERFVVSYVEEAGFANSRAFVTSFDLTETEQLAIAERRTSLGDIGTYHIGGALGMAARWSGGLGSRFVGIGIDDATSGESNVRGVTFHDAHGRSPAFQYCYGNPNSTGDRGFIRMQGNRSATDLKVLHASALPANAYGYFLVGDTFAQVANPGGSAGVLCIGGNIGRYSNAVMSSGDAGQISIPFSPLSISQPTGAVVGMAGQVWQFTLWHRDSVGGTSTSNFTNAMTIMLD